MSPITDDDLYELTTDDDTTETATSSSDPLPTATKSVQSTFSHALQPLFMPFLGPWNNAPSWIELCEQEVLQQAQEAYIQLATMVLSPPELDHFDRAGQHRWLLNRLTVKADMKKLYLEACISPVAALDAGLRCASGLDCDQDGLQAMAFFQKLVIESPVADKRCIQLAHLLKIAVALRFAPTLLAERRQVVAVMLQATFALKLLPLPFVPRAIYVIAVKFFRRRQEYGFPKAFWQLLPPCFIDGLFDAMDAQDVFGDSGTASEPLEQHFLPQCKHHGAGAQLQASNCGHYKPMTTSEQPPCIDPRVASDARQIIAAVETVAAEHNHTLIFFNRATDDLTQAPIQAVPVIDWHSMMADPAGLWTSAGRRHLELPEALPEALPEPTFHDADASASEAGHAAAPSIEIERAAGPGLVRADESPSIELETAPLILLAVEKAVEVSQRRELALQALLEDEEDETKVKEKKKPAKARGSGRHRQNKSTKLFSERSESDSSSDPERTASINPASNRFSVLSEHVGVAGNAASSKSGKQSDSKRAENELDARQSIFPKAAQVPLFQKRLLHGQENHQPPTKLPRKKKQSITISVGKPSYRPNILAPAYSTHQIKQNKTSVHENPPKPESFEAFPALSINLSRKKQSETDIHGRGYFGQLTAATDHTPAHTPSEASSETFGTFSSTVAFETAPSSPVHLIYADAGTFAAEYHEDRRTPKQSTMHSRHRSLSLPGRLVDDSDIDVGDGDE